MGTTGLNGRVLYEEVHANEMNSITALHPDRTYMNIIHDNFLRFMMNTTLKRKETQPNPSQHLYDLLASRHPFKFSCLFECSPKKQF